MTDLGAENQRVIREQRTGEELWDKFGAIALAASELALLPITTVLQWHVQRSFDSLAKDYQLDPITMTLRPNTVNNDTLYS